MGVEDLALSVRGVVLLECVKFTPSFKPSP
jgi:hypothetical protein